MRATTNIAGGIAKKRVLVHLHVFYVDELSYYLKRLAAARGLADFHLCASVSRTISDFTEVEKSVKELFPDAEVFQVENVGYDIAPFVQAVNSADLDAYDYVLKLHTKSRGYSDKAWLNDKQVCDRVWTDYLVSALIGSPHRFEAALKAMEDDEVGMVASRNCIIVDKPIRRDHYVWRVNDELERMGLPGVENLHFVAGTMFLVRAELMKPLRLYAFDDFGVCFPGIYDYTLAHTFERLLSGIVLSQGKRIAGLESEKTSLFVGLCAKHFAADKGKLRDVPLLKKAKKDLFRVKRRLRFQLLGERIIEKSGLFDSEWYLKQNPGIGNEKPAHHYLTKGYREGCNPSLMFDNEAYYDANPDIRKKGYNPLLHYECYGKGGKRSIGKQSNQATPQVNTIRNSRLFDPEFYTNNNPDVKHEGKDPAEHYLLHGGFEGRDPSPLFSSDEYLTLHPDVRRAHFNPLYHYELEGFIQGHELSFLEISEPSFPDRASDCSAMFNVYPSVHRRTAVVAAFSADGRIHESLLYLISGLKEVVDNIVIIGDCPLFPEELEKLDEIATYVSFERSGQYDFGSYKRGLAVARKLGLLNAEDVDELVVMNDSCYGPVYPFSESFEAMERRDWDFWGYYSNKILTWQLGSNFYVFNRKVIDSKLLDEFFCRVNGKIDRGVAIQQFEVELTRVLQLMGMRAMPYVAWDDRTRNNHRKILTAIRNYRMPLVKKKSLAGEAVENIEATLRIIERDNPELFRLIERRPAKPMSHAVPSLEDFRRSIPSIEREIRNKVEDGGVISSVFLVNDASMFPGGALLDAMLEDEMFDPRIAVIPDMRWPRLAAASMKRCRDFLESQYPAEIFLDTKADRYGRWPDVVSGADIVCYPSPYYHLSTFNYNPRFVLGRRFLPIIFNYGYYRSIYDRELMGFHNYAYCWKVFLECEENMEEYRTYSVLKGANASLVGYAKMDSLAGYERKGHSRPRILVALHHSIDGGYNETLGLANFIRYFDYFKALPERFPEVDFVYRPHPALFKALKGVERWSDKDVATYIDSMKAKHNVIWNDGGDYFQEFADSDACIQDCGSFLVEYVYTGKPCCYMLKDPADIDAKFAPLGKACLEQCYLSYSTDDIDRFIREVVVAGEDPKAPGRAELAKRVMVNYPHAAEAALQDIKDTIMNGSAAPEEGR